MTVKGLVLSIFPGADLLGRGFTEAGYCVVRGGDPMFGQEPIETFHPPAGVFEGVIGGPPCQRYAQSHNLSGDKDRHPHLVPEFERVVSEAQPDWWLMEMVVSGPAPIVEGYETQTQKLYAGEFGVPQLRRRRFTFGTKRGALLLLWPRGELGDYHHTFTAFPSAQRRRDGTRANDGKFFTLDDYRQAFGLPASWDAEALLKRYKSAVLGNAVPVPVAYALACAIRAATTDAPFQGERVQP